MTDNDRQLRTEVPPGQQARDRLLDAMPLTERRLQLAGVSTAVLEGGDGPPIVLLHGAGEFAAVWILVIPELVRTHRVIVPDLPGHGASHVTDSTLDHDAVLDWLDELIDQTCGGRAPILVGHLMGGSIAARYTAKHGSRIDRLVLVDTLGLGWFRPSPKFAVPMMRFAMRPTPRSRERLFNQCFLDMNRVAELAGEQWQWLMEYADDRARDPGVQSAMRKLISRLGAPPIPAGDLAGIETPTTLIHGRHDLQVSLRRVESSGKKYGWPVLVIEDCRDDPAAEQPAAFLRALRSAIDKHETAEKGTER
ncbi:MAG TPA: alpha/beta hydrolase [Jiangellaceae bacterium]